MMNLPRMMNLNAHHTALFTVGFAYAIGIVLALVICSATSGGHLHPAITIVMTLFKGFPPLKAVRSVFLLLSLLMFRTWCSLRITLHIDT